MTFSSPTAFVASVTTPNGSNQLYLGASNVAAKIHADFEGFSTNIELDIGDLTTCMTNFVRGNFLCGCHLQMHTSQDANRSQNSCFWQWELPVWSHAFRVTFPVVAFQEFSFIYGLAFKDGDTKVKSTIAFGPKYCLNLTLATKFESRRCIFNAWMARRSISDGNVEWLGRASVDVNVAADTKLSFAKLTDHYAVGLKRKLDTGVQLSPSLLYKDGLIGARIGIVYNE
jgi:hypothetical protein